MRSVGRICLYCSKPISTEDRVACCDRCWAAHHEDCWERNGRCSTFRCAGLPRTMRGEDLPTVLRSAMEKANDEPKLCPLCSGDVYPGVIQSRKNPNPDGKASPLGLWFVGRLADEDEGRGWGRRILKKVLGKKSWYLPGAHIKARSCVRCRRLFLWGVLVDDLVQRKDESERFCPHCSSELAVGKIVLDPSTPGGARFECDETPSLHKDWFGHNVLDRFFFSKWNPIVKSLPAHSCPECQYTDVAGRPVYRFL